MPYHNAFNDSAALVLRKAFSDVVMRVLLTELGSSAGEI
jgi:hypothetical protein